MLLLASAGRGGGTLKTQTNHNSNSSYCSNISQHRKDSKDSKLASHLDARLRQQTTKKTQLLAHLARIVLSLCVCEEGRQLSLGRNQIRSAPLQYRQEAPTSLVRLVGLWDP